MPGEGDRHGPRVMLPAPRAALDIREEEGNSVGRAIGHQERQTSRLDQATRRRFCLLAVPNDAISLASRPQCRSNPGKITAEDREFC